MDKSSVSGLTHRIGAPLCLVALVVGTQPSLATSSGAVLVQDFEGQAQDAGKTVLLTKRSWRDRTTGMDFVWTPAGCFQMGSQGTKKDQQPNFSPMHEVCVDGFWVGSTEVTNRQYRKWKSGHDSGTKEGVSLNGDDQPAVSVRWEDAQEYAKWLSGQSGKPVRLPTEAEWEYAARGGSTTTWYWGDDPSQACEHANVADRTAKNKLPELTVHECNDGYMVTAPVGIFKSNAFGLHDMVGNVWEWCSDWYDDQYYGQSPRNNPTGPSDGANHVSRGGSWNTGPGHVVAVNRWGHTKGCKGHDDVGFRLVFPGNQ